MYLFCHTFVSAEFIACLLFFVIHCRGCERELVFTASLHSDKCCLDKWIGIVSHGQTHSTVQNGVWPGKTTLDNGLEGRSVDKGHIISIQTLFFVL